MLGEDAISSLFHNLATMNTVKILIPTVAVCPLRLEPDHRSEMSSQLLLGEPLRQLDDSQPGWIKVEGLLDGYSGWCQAIQVAELVQPAPSPIGFFSGSTGFANVNGEPMLVFKGTPVYPAPIRAGSFSISFTGLVCQQPPADNTASLIRSTAFQYLNTAYCWGGRTQSGIDCSGFAQMVFRQAGIFLKRDAWMQAAEGEEVRLESARLADLAFFDEPDGRITHVGILLNSQEIIHASGKVRVDDIDAEGILSRDQGRLTHHLRVVKRVF